MTDNPLAPPGDDSAARDFLRYLAVDWSIPGGNLLHTVAVAFSRLPYENLTKIIKEAEFGRSAQARRGPREVFSDHVALGTGGTCFSLTAAFLYLVRTLGYQAEPILADRRYGKNTHCALLVWIDGRPHLLDPGYLIVDPIALPDAEKRLQTAFNELVLVPAADLGRMELHTIEGNGRKHRLTYKLRPVGAPEFCRTWDESFGWDMMRYPLLTRTQQGKQLYMRGNHLQVRTLEAVERREIAPGRLAAQIASEFGIAPSVAARALSILTGKGERLG